MFWSVLKIIIAIVSGIFLIPIPLAFTKHGDNELAFWDSIWGNDEDTINGDCLWYPEWVQQQNWFVKAFPRYWWCAIRNPAQNLRDRLGAHGVVQAIVRSKPNPHTLGVYRVDAVVSRTPVTFYYAVWKWPIIDRYFRVAFGPKIWEKVQVGDTIHAIFALSVLPFITKATASV